MAADIDVGDRWEPYDDEQDAIDAWERRLEGAKYEDDVTPEVLAEEIGDVSEDYARQVWERAFDRVMADGRSAFALQDFVTAHEAVNKGPLGPDQDDDSGLGSDDDETSNTEVDEGTQDSEFQQLRDEVRAEATAGDATGAHQGVPRRRSAVSQMGTITTEEWCGVIRTLRTRFVPAAPRAVRQPGRDCTPSR